MYDAEIKLRMAEKGFYEVPEFMQPEELKRAVNGLFKGEAYVCSNPQGTFSIFSEAGFKMEFAK